MLIPSCAKRASRPSKPQYSPSSSVWNQRASRALTTNQPSSCGTRPASVRSRAASANARKEERALLLQHFACDHQTLNLVRAFVDLRDLRVAHHPFERIFLDVAVAAEHLHGVSRHLHRDVRAEELRHRGELRQLGT